MSFLEYRVKFAPTGFGKVLYVNWGLYLLVCACATIGWLMLYSISGGDLQQWAEPQMKRFAAGMVLSLAICFTPIWFWRSMSAAAYIVTFILLLVVQFFGTVGMGAQRWIDLGFIRIQPSEFMKVSLIMMLATYYDWLEDRKVSRPIWVIVPVLLIIVPAVLVLMEPNLGTTLMLVVAGASVMFAAGVSLWYFVAVLGLIGAGIAGIVFLRGTPWQLIHDYQYRRIDTFLDPSADPLGAGYNILQAKIALGSGIVRQGLYAGHAKPVELSAQKHTDFIFTTLGEEFGFVGEISLLTLYAAILIFLFWAAMQ